MFTLLLLNVVDNVDGFITQDWETKTEIFINTPHEVIIDSIVGT